MKVVTNMSTPDLSANDLLVFNQNRAHIQKKNYGIIWESLNTHPFGNANLFFYRVSNDDYDVIMMFFAGMMRLSMGMIVVINKVMISGRYWQ